MFAQGTGSEAVLLPPLDQQVNNGVSVLRAHGVLAFPTDTLYGLGADAFCDEAVDRVFSIKGRPVDAPVPILLATESDLIRVATDIPPLVHVLAKEFWPGGLTLVLWRMPGVLLSVTGGGETVGVRVPAHPVPLELIKRFGSPITGTSANASGEAAPSTADEVHRKLHGKIDLIIDGGPCPRGMGSTVLDLTARMPRLVRVGAVSAADLRLVCGDIE